MEAPADNLRPPSSLKTAISCAAILLSCLAGVYIIAVITPLVYQYNYTYVGENFAKALMENDLRLARRVTAPSQWDRIDGWMSTHDPFNCPFSWDFDDNQRFSTGSLSEQGAMVSFFHSCWVDGFYEFRIDEIILYLDENRWQVVDWSEVQETR